MKGVDALWYRVGAKLWQGLWESIETDTWYNLNSGSGFRRDGHQEWDLE